MKLLPLLDYEFLGRFSKIFIGFSDITALLVNLVEKCHWVVFHGPTVTALGTADSQSIENFRLAVSGGAPLTLWATKGRIMMPGCATGKLMVGNLTTLCHLVGTPYFPDFSGSILLIEDRGEAPYRIDRMLTQMKMAGCFSGLSGLALGSFTECGDAVQVETIVTKLFSDCRIPILSGFEVGHTDRNFTLPLGLTATLDTQTQTLRLLSTATVPPDI
jgi:muramoyltetrapeptide carboxypeptidase